MLLNELSISADRKITRINRLLKETYGFVLTSNVEVKKLERLASKIAEDIYELKLNGETPRDAEYSKKLLIKEGIATMLSKHKLAEGMTGPGSNVYRRVVSWLTDYACKLIDIGDSVDDAVTDAMRHYRSSKYRFPDMEVEHDLRKEIAACTDDFVSPELSEPVPLYDTIYEDYDEEGATLDELVDAISYRISRQHVDAIQKYGLDKMMSAITSVADFYVGTTELGSSDISIMVNAVLRELGEGDIKEESLADQQRKARDEEYRRAAEYVPPKEGEPGYEKHVEVTKQEQARQLAHKLAKKVHDKKGLDLNQFADAKKDFKNRILSLLDKGMSYEEVERKMLGENK